MNLIFDLDGTLIDSRMRLYSLFRHLVPETSFSFSEYWRLKRNKVSHQQILADRFGFDGVAIERFTKNWMDLIETPEFLGLDVSIPGIDQALERLQERARLHVCTARQHRTSALEQIERFALSTFFDHVLVTEQTESKQALISARVPGLGAQDWMIGDTGHDIQAGKTLGIKTCAVLSGFQNRAILSGYAPDLILDSAVEFVPDTP